MQIFSYLHPLDLLDLARTTKPFRALLMSRSFAGVWRASRKLIQELPVCPGHLSEPAYANLVFSSHCHVRCYVALSDHCINCPSAELSEAERQKYHLGVYGSLLPSMQENYVGPSGLEGSHLLITSRRRTVKITDKHTCAEFFCMQYAELSPLVNMVRGSCQISTPLHSDSRDLVTVEG